MCDKLWKNSFGSTLEDCECATASPTESPAPTVSHNPSLSPSISIAPTAKPSSTPPNPNAFCTLTWDDYLLEPTNWIYTLMFVAVVVLFYPTVRLFQVLEPQPSRTGRFLCWLSLFFNFVGDLQACTFLTVTILALLSIENRPFACNGTSFKLNIIVVSLDLGVNKVGEIAAACALGNARNLCGDLNSVTWQGMEFLGGRALTLYSTVLMTCSVSVVSLVYLWFGIALSGNTKDVSPIGIAGFCIMSLSAMPSLLIPPLYEWWYDGDFRCWDLVCKDPSRHCAQLSWRNLEGQQPHCGPVWGGGSRIALECALYLLSFGQFLLNIDSGFQTYMLLLLTVLLKSIRAVQNLGCCH